MSISRRRLLHGGAGLLGCALGGTRHAGAAPGRAPDHVVLVHLRGGADGLSLVVPYTSEAYYRARRSTAVAPPGRAGGRALPLAAGLGLHPQLGALHASFHAGELAVVLGVGLPELVRSHSSASRSLDDAVRHALCGEQPEPFVGSLETQLAGVARRLREPGAPRAFGVESLGWDTHAAQGDGRDGRLAAAVAELARGVQRFRAGLGVRGTRVLVVVLTEFGRSLCETPLEGTDDGHASVLFLLGGGRPWGRLFGRLPSLEPSALSEGRYLRPALDVRDVLVRVVRGEDPA